MMTNVIGAALGLGGYLQIPSAHPSGLKNESQQCAEEHLPGFKSFAFCSHLGFVANIFIWNNLKCA